MEILFALLASAAGYLIAVGAMSKPKWALSVAVLVLTELFAGNPLRCFIFYNFGLVVTVLYYKLAHKQWVWDRR